MEILLYIHFGHFSKDENIFLGDLSSEAYEMTL
jgi:hypothetical protein